MSEESATPVSFYEAVGGEETFHRLVAVFYEGVAQDAILRPLYYLYSRDVSVYAIKRTTA